MKSTKYISDLKAMSADQLAAELVNAKKELFNLRFQHVTGQLENTGRIKEVKKNIARIETVMQQMAAKN